MVYVSLCFPLFHFEAKKIRSENGTPSQLWLTELWQYICHTKPDHVRDESLHLALGRKGGWGYCVHSTGHMYSTFYTLSSKGGRGIVFYC